MNAAIVWNEMRQSWRGLLRRPGYLVLAMATLALGVATSTAVFSLIDQALLKPLPYPQADRLVTIGQYSSDVRNVAAPAYLAPVRGMQSLKSVGMLRGWVMDANVARGEQSEVVRSIRADRGFLDTLALPMAAGRNFSVDEDRPNGPQAVILSHAYWQHAYGGQVEAVGASLLVEGRAAQIVGVLPAAFQWPDTFDVILPLQPDPVSPVMSTNEMIVARLAPDASVASASAEADNVIGTLLRASAAMNDDWRAALVRYPPNALPLQRSVFSANSGNTLWLFLGAAACVLLIATVNLTSLMLLRALGRSHDSAVRTALGASLSRLGLPALAEGILIGLLGTVTGLLLAWSGLRLFGGTVPPDWVRGDPVSLTGGSIVFAVICGLSVAVLAVLLGVWRTRALDLAGELVGGGRGGWSRGAGRLGRGLVIAQVALAVVLLTGAALFTRTLHELSKVPMGFEGQSVSLFNLAPVKSQVGDVDAMSVQTQRIIERLERVPGIARASAASNPPTTTQLNWSFLLPDTREISAQYRFMTPDMFDVYRIPVLVGRGFAEGDTAGGEPVCVVSAEFAKRYLQGDPLGQVVSIPDDDDNSRRTAMRVVGVVGDVRQFGPSEPAPAIVYTPLAQLPDASWQLVRGFGGLTYAYRTQHGVAVDEKTLRDAVAEMAPRQPISNLRTMDAVVASTTSQQKLNLLLIGLFAALALLLACVGLYAVMATSVAARRHEFGVRAALGASPARLLRQVLLESGRQIALGLAIGLAVALAGSRVLQGFLFGVGAADPLAIALVLLLLALTGALASLVPALRAARVPPMQALRT